MEPIIHKTFIEASPSSVFEVISTLGGLRSWWTNAVSGTPEKNGELRVRLTPEHHLLFAIPVLKNNSHMSFLVKETTAPDSEALLGTLLTLSVAPADDRTTEVTFEHSGWTIVSDAHTLSTDLWEKRLASLKKLCETGKGDPEIVTLPRK